MPRDAPQPSDVQVFHGDVSAAEARVYARWCGDPARAPTKLWGTLRGPRSAYAHTLMATVKLADQGPGPAPLARAVLPEPCVWTPDTPYLYDLMIFAERDGERVGPWELAWGVRPLAVQGSALKLDGRVWAPRAVRLDPSESPIEHFAAARATGTALRVENPDEALCAAADQTGVFLVAELDAAVSSEDVVRLGQHPSIAMACFDSRPSISTDALRQLAPNLLVAQVARDEAEVDVNFGQLLVVDLDSTAPIERQLQRLARLHAKWDRPILARRTGIQGELPELRAACDQLQRDLAGSLPLAGYLV